MFTITGDLPARLVYLPQIAAVMKNYRRAGNVAMKSCTSSQCVSVRVSDVGMRVSGVGTCVSVVSRVSAARPLHWNRCTSSVLCAGEAPV